MNSKISKRDLFKSEKMHIRSSKKRKALQKIREGKQRNRRAWVSE
jgi:hypothetical protein